MLLDFLSKVTLEETVDKVQKVSGPRKERNPKGIMGFRLFRDGSIYPSQELVDTFFLDYAGRDVESGYGFDIIDTLNFPTFKTPQRILLASPVKKSAGKVDVFGATTYDEDGNPKISVMDQGAKTFGKEDLIPAVEEIYNIRFAQPAVKDKEGKEVEPAVEGVDYVDLVLVANPATGEPWTTPKPICYIPKKVSRGEAKGSITTTRREDVKLYALVPAELAQPAEVQAPAQAKPVVEKGMITDEAKLSVETEVLVEEDDNPFKD